MRLPAQPLLMPPEVLLAATQNLAGQGASCAWPSALGQAQKPSLAATALPPSQLLCHNSRQRALTRRPSAPHLSGGQGRQPASQEGQPAVSLRSVVLPL